MTKTMRCLSYSQEVASRQVQDRFSGKPRIEHDWLHETIKLVPIETPEDEPPTMLLTIESMRSRKSLGTDWQIGETYDVEIGGDDADAPERSSRSERRGAQRSPHPA